MSNDRYDGLTRREFIRAAGGSAAVVGMGALTGVAPGQVQTRPADRSKGKPKYPKPVLPYGMLGRTEYPVTLISFGAILIREKLGTRVVKAGIDRGINLLHTSASYTKGNSIQAIGELFKAEKGYRDKVFLCLKSYHPEKESEIDEMLAALSTDHVDAIFTEFHEGRPERLEALQAQQDKLKKKGKIRHTGFVCHGDMNGVMELILAKAPEYFDVTLMSMSMLPPPEKRKPGAAEDAGQRFLKNLKALRGKGVGILAMKSGARSAVTKGAEVFLPHARNVLEGGADSVLASMDTFDQVEMVKGLDLRSPHATPKDKKAEADFQRSRGDVCLMCGDCTKACPHGIPVSDLMRVRMYHQEYGWADHARAELATLGVEAGTLASVCAGCIACSRACPVNLASARTVHGVAGLLA